MPAVTLIVVPDWVKVNGIWVNGLEVSWKNPEAIVAIASMVSVYALETFSRTWVGATVTTEGIASTCWGKVTVLVLVSVTCRVYAPTGSETAGRVSVCPACAKLALIVVDPTNRTCAMLPAETVTVKLDEVVTGTTRGFTFRIVRFERTV